VDVLLERCAGVDIGKDEVVACVRRPESGGGRRKETHTFRSFTGDLEAMAEWFSVQGVTEVVMGATGPRGARELAKGTLRKKIPELRRALRGRFRDHHALLLGLCLDHTAHLEAATAKLDERVDALFAANVSEAGVPFGQARDRLDTIPRVGKRAAETIIAEIGVDMSRFPTAAHLASWAGMAPGNNITGGNAGPAARPRATWGSATSSPSARGPLLAPATRTWPHSSAARPPDR